jgi:hypothetical protein
MAIVRLECHIGRASRTFIVPAAFVGEPTFIERHLWDGSLGVIDLLPKNHTGGSSLVADGAHEVDALDLHLCAEQLTRNVPGSGRVSKIALILAERYRPRPGIFGIMFDRGYSTEDDPNNNPLFTGTPREGCAIFLGAIKELRPNIADFDREVEFTTIHELGHIFNLDHVSSPRSFMATSSRNAPFPDDYFEFYDEQKKWLAECDTNSSVYPGGSKFEPVSGFNVTDETARYRSTHQITLNIGVANSTFPCLSPIELDVELRAKPGTNRYFYVQDRLDPGYKEFRIWITYPNGEKRLFKSPRRYCAPVSRVAIGKGQSQHRDISIFEGAGGTTFSKPGLYHIQAEYDLGHRGCIVSNVVTVEAVINKMLMPAERVALFADNSVRRFLYHRSKKCGFEIIRRLEKHLGTYPDGAGANDIRYALVRALTDDVDALQNRERKKILKHIQSTHEIDGALGVRQRYHLQKLFKRLSN